MFVTELVKQFLLSLSEREYLLCPRLAAARGLALQLLLSPGSAPLPVSPAHRSGMQTMMPPFMLQTIPTWVGADSSP